MMQPPDGAVAPPVTQPHEFDSGHSTRELENRLTKLETTVDNLKTFVVVRLIALGVILSFVVFIVERTVP